MPHGEYQRLCRQRNARSQGPLQQPEQQAAVDQFFQDGRDADEDLALLADLKMPIKELAKTL